ncbi:MAG: flippase, partial [Patescibacteria group bacterium]
MSLTRRVATNTFLNVGGKLAAVGLSIVTVGILTRYLGQAGFGNYTTVMAFLQFFGIVVDFGLATAVVQLISSRPHQTDRLFANAFSFRLVTAVVFFALAPMVMLLLPYSAELKTSAFIATWALCLVSLNQVLMGIFQRELKMFWPVVAEIIGRAIFLVGMIVVVTGHGTLVAVMAAVTIGNLVQFILTYWAARRLTILRLAFDWRTWQELFFASWPIGLSIIFNLVYFKADTVILSLYQSQAVVGIYGAPYKMLEALSALPYLFMGLILPLLSASWAANNREKFRQQLQRSWDVLAVVTWPLVIGGIIVATPLMVLIAGPEFQPSGAVLQILLIATAAIYASVIFTHAIVALERQRQMLPAFGGVAAVALAAYFWLIPQYSYLAAAWITVGTEVAIGLLAWLVVRRALGRHMLAWRVTVRAAAASAVMALALIVLQLVGAPVVITIFVGPVIYGLAAYIFGAIDREVIK